MGGAVIRKGGKKAWMTILLAEDNEDLALVYRIFLVGTGHRVIPAANGEEVLRGVQANLPDLVLLDLEMPVMSGREALEHLRAAESTEHLPVVIFTNQALDPAVEARLESLGVEAIVIKVLMPPEDLVGWLNRWRAGVHLPVRGRSSRHREGDRRRDDLR